jgi:hypothetical protein
MMSEGLERRFMDSAALEWMSLIGYLVSINDKNILLTMKQGTKILTNPCHGHKCKGSLW